MESTITQIVKKAFLSLIQTYFVSLCLNQSIPLVSGQCFYIYCGVHRNNQSFPFGWEEEHVTCGR